MAVKNEILTVTYETALGGVTLTAEDVKNYLVHGNSAVSDKEIKLFMELCKYQKLNPFTGEAYAIKFGSEFQMVVGYETYKRRAEENPAYRGRKSGIVVLRGESVVQKEGTCVYPTETLIGGWCRVFVKRPEFTDEMYKEVSLEEYNKGQANRKTKPATMIEKVAVSQALRAAFPTDYAGLYTVEEVRPEGYSEPDVAPGEVTDITPNEDGTDVIISQEQRQELLSTATEFYGKKKGEAVIKYICNQLGLESTTNMTIGIFEQAMKTLNHGIEIDKQKLDGQQNSENEE